jgi:hypothetical protein
MQALPTLVLALLALVPSALGAQQVERYTLEGDDIAIYNLVGALSIEPGTGSVAVELVRGGPDAARLRIERGEVRGRETLRVVYPSQEVAYARLEHGSSTTLKVREDGTFGDGEGHHDHDYDEDDDRSQGRTVRISRERGDLRAYADMKVRVPVGFRVAFHLAVGHVSVANVNGQILVDSHSAPVTATGPKGTLAVDVGYGNVRVSGADGTLSVDTGSGSVEVTGFRGDKLSIDTGSGQVSGSELHARSTWTPAPVTSSSPRSPVPSCRSTPAAGALRPTCADRCAIWRWKRDPGTSRCGRPRRSRARWRSRRRVGRSRRTSRFR